MYVEVFYGSFLISSQTLILTVDSHDILSTLWVYSHVNHDQNLYHVWPLFTKHVIIKVKAVCKNY